LSLTVFTQRNFVADFLRAKCDFTGKIAGYLSVNSPELIFDLINAKPGTNPTNPNGNSKR